MKTKVLLTCFFALSLGFNAFAMRILTGDDVRITEPIQEDVYVFGGSIDIDAPVHGDVWCAGGTVTVNDTVYGDLVAAGGNVYLRGIVLDDVRAAGGTLSISGSIGGDLLMAGGTVTTESTAAIGGDVATSGGTLTLGSDIKGELKAIGSVVHLNGSIGENLEFNGGELNLNGIVGGASQIAATKIRVGKNAALRGNVHYWTDEGTVDFGPALQNGAAASFDPSLREQFERPHYKYLGFATFMGVLWYLIASFILLWIGQWLFSRTFFKAAGTAQADPMRALGYGFLFFAAVPVGIVLLFITIVGIPAGLIALFFYILFFALANVITALVGAHWINTRRHYNWRPINLVLVALGLMIGLKILFAVPFLGWIIAAAAILIAFGAILVNTRGFGRRSASVAQN